MKKIFIVTNRNKILIMAEANLVIKINLVPIIKHMFFKKTYN